MNPEFVVILQKLIAEQGKETLLNTAKCKALLSDYTRNEYKRESRFLSQALDAGVQKAIDKAENIKICKLQQIRLLHEDYGLDEKVAAGVVDTLALILRGDTGKTEIQAVQSQPAHTQPSAPLQSPASGGFVLINGGTFTMGSPKNEQERNDNEGPQHQVTVSSFNMGKYEVTQKEYQEVMGANPSYFKGDNLPVEQVSWFDAIEYCNRRSQKEGLILVYVVNGTNVVWNQNANGYRLPTEAEWEYACRAGTTTPFNTGKNITTSQANYNGNYPYKKNAKGTYFDKPTPVGSFYPNNWGLYDMHGNVWEWCWDWYADYHRGAQTDPLGASSEFYRVDRGGGWGNNAHHLRSAYRNGITSSNRHNDLGFRLVRPCSRLGT